MGKRFGLRIISAAIACLVLQAPTMAATKYKNELASYQILKPANLTPEELKYYNSATDPVVKRNFIVTRSYVRLAEKAVAKKIPSCQFPTAKPDGFKVQFLLPKDKTAINKALKIALIEYFNNPKRQCPH